MGPTAMCSHTEGMSKILKKSLKLITVHDTVKTNVLGFRDNNLSYDIQRHLSNGHAYHAFGQGRLIRDVPVEFPIGITEGTMHIQF
jgi:hypothetical protein